VTVRVGARRRYRVGVVADTHVGDALPALPEGVVRALEGVDLIVHAGDVTIAAVLGQLERIAPVVAVQGNHDRRADLELPAARIVRIGGARIGVTHGDRGPLAEAGWGLAGIVAGRPVLAGVPRTLASRFVDVDCVVFGHFHVPFVGRTGEVTVFSPGSVYVVDADPAAGTPRGVKGRAYRRYRRGLPVEARRPQVGVLEIVDGIVVPRFVPIDGPLRAGGA
jgi:uncharacterized protein